MQIKFSQLSFIFYYFINTRFEFYKNIIKISYFWKLEVVCLEY